MIHVDSKMIHVVSKIITVNSNLFFKFGAWNRNTHSGFEIDICRVQNMACCLELILVRLLFLNYICGIETLHVVSKRHYKFLKSHSVMLEKQGIFVYVLFHSLACYFENRLCRSDFASCCFETTPCGFENTPLVETISYHILPIISIP
jgi:hypothetical protein